MTEKVPAFLRPIAYLRRKSRPTNSMQQSYSTEDYSAFIARNASLDTAIGRCLFEGCECEQFSNEGMREESFRVVSKRFGEEGIAHYERSIQTTCNCKHGKVWHEKLPDEQTPSLGFPDQGASNADGPPPPLLFPTSADDQPGMGRTLPVEEQLQLPSRGCVDDGLTSDEEERVCEGGEKPGVAGDVGGAASVVHDAVVAASDMKANTGPAEKCCGGIKSGVDLGGASLSNVDVPGGDDMAAQQQASVPSPGAVHQPIEPSEPLSRDAPGETPMMRRTPKDPPAASPSDHLATNPSDHLSTNPPDHLSTNPPDHLSTNPPDHLSTNPSDQLPIQRSEHPPHVPR